MLGSVNSIESFGTVDGPGIRCVVFLNKCLLRCKYCHNPEMWHMQKDNYSADELVTKILRYKPYFNTSGGGVTFSGGEPLLQSEFLTEVSKKLKENNIHLALDTAGYSFGDYEELLKYIDLIIFDVKDIGDDRYKSLTGGNYQISLMFLKRARRLKKKFWIRQVVVPGLHDNDEYLEMLSRYIKENFDKDMIDNIEFLPYHKLGIEKYERLGIESPYKDLEEMNPEYCKELYKKFLKIYNSVV